MLISVLEFYLLYNKVRFTSLTQSLMNQEQFCITVFLDELLQLVSPSPYSIYID